MASASATSLNVSWAAPSNAGPAITDYDYRYRVKVPQGSWTEVTTTPITALGATITGLAENTEYEVQVRATNAEGTGGWSDPSGRGSTDANAAPSFTSPATFNAAENQLAVGTLAAADGDPGDSVTGYAIQGGADASRFTIIASTGELTFTSAPNFEAVADADTNNDYVVVVRATSGTGGREKTADQTITVTVTDVGGEAPGAPATPTVSTASVTSLNVSWAAPSNAGPAITDYDYRYRVKTPQGSWTEVTTTPITALGATIAGLAENREYEVQVRATNAEGTGGWSDPPGRGATDGNAAPSFTSPATFNAAENQLAVGTVAAADGDAGDSVTGYAIESGADASRFTIVEATGELTFTSAPNFEAATDADADNDYVVVVRATSGTGGREKTADQTITVTVTDVGGEATGAPATPSVSATSGSATSLEVSWTAPANAGRPAITSYDLQYRIGDSGGFTTGPQDVTGLRTTIEGLTANTGYEVQVRATNAEGDSGWSASGAGSTSPPANNVPEFSDATLTRSIAENVAPNTNIGAAIPAATDADSGDTLTYAMEGTDAVSFTFEASSRWLKTRAALDYEAKSSYSVTITVSDGTDSDTVAVTITVTDVGEPPAAPAAPSVSATSDSATSLDVSWTALPNTGRPAITSYDLQYRIGDSGSFTAGPQNVTGTNATITGLTASTSYEVQVCATNADGNGDWSASGTGSTSRPLRQAWQAWQARFGRTVGLHMTDAVGERLRAAPGQGSQVTVGGYRLPLGQGAAEPEGVAEPEAAADPLSSLLTGLAGVIMGPGATQPGQGGMGTDPWAVQQAPDPRLGQTHTLNLNLNLRDVLLGSSFRLTLGGDDAQPVAMRLTAWGRVAGTQFNGRDRDVALDGDVLTGTLGVDSEWDRWLAGVAVSHSRGDGLFTMMGAEAQLRGDLENTLTSLHPYLRYAVTDRVDVWGVLGYGWGDLTLKMGTDAPIETDTDFVMGAVGGRGILLSALENGGFELATRTDAMLTRLSSDAVAGLAVVDADAHRVRLVLEGSRPVLWPEGQSVTPAVELGVRHDWGDAETGFGLELGGRVQYADPTLGLTLDAAVRGLLAHEDRDYDEWGASGTLRIVPGPDGQGLSLALTPTWGAVASGVDGLWSRQTTAGLAPQGRTQAQVGQLNAEVGYGLWVPSLGGLVRSFTGVTFTGQGGSRSRVGLVFDRPGTWGAGLRVELVGESRTTTVGQSEQTIGLQLQFTFGSGRRAAQGDNGRRAAQGDSGRRVKVLATPVRSPTTPDGVVTGPQTPTPTRADNVRRRASARHQATTGHQATAKPPGTALDGDGGSRRRHLVQLGAFSNHAAALRAKTELAVDLRGLLLHRRLAVVRSKGDGLARVVFVQVFPTPEAAAALCAAIKTRGPACSVTAVWPAPGRDPHGRRVAEAHGGR